MKKIGIALVTLLAVATSACTESPTATAASAEAAFGGSGSEQVVVRTDEANAMATTEAARNPGFGGSGN